MNQVSDVILFFSNDFTLMSNYYSENEDIRHRFVFELEKGLKENADENRIELCIDLKDCADFGALLRKINLELTKQEVDRSEDRPLSIWQRIMRALDRRLEQEEKHVCLVLEDFHLCRTWDDPDFSWFREFLYHSSVFSCIAVSDQHLERFAHRPSFGSPLSNIFTVVEKITEESYE